MNIFQNYFGNKLNSKESKEVMYSGTLGFDFIFGYNDDDKLFCKIIEINGEESGIGGASQVEGNEKDYLARVRNHMSTERAQVHEKKVGIAKEVLESDDLNVSDEGYQKMQDYVLRSVYESVNNPKMFPLSNTNPEWLEAYTVDKSKHNLAIPDKYKIRTWKPGTSLESSTGWWVCKPKRQRAGSGIFFLRNMDFKSEFIDKDLQEYYVAQEFFPSAGAQEATNTYSGNPASARLLWDFRVLKNGKIEVDFERAYQRVSKYRAYRGVDDDNQPIYTEERAVVNMARGAESFPMSKEELKLARLAAVATIKSITKAHQKGKI